MNINKRNIYFIGIGGIGMSALARYFVAKGSTVAGYDRVSSEITDALQILGISIHFNDDISDIPDHFKNPKETLVIYTPAIPVDHNELSYFKTHAFQIMKRSQVLGAITKSTTCLAVAGTHGKTTTTSILGHLLYESNVAVTAFLGGISENYNSNLILKGTEVSVVEADEFDRSFLTLFPDLACITSMDADHLDIYGEKKKLELSFIDFTKQIKPGGKLFVKNGLPITGITYGIEDNSDYSISNIKITDGTYVFDVKTPKISIKDVEFNLPGRHNLSNALIALAMALEYGCPHQQLVKALASYQGVKRRFSYQIKTSDLVFIDDYAHHPEEINAIYNTIKELYPKKESLVIFQPHLYSRTKDFVDDFGKSLSQFNEVVLLPIYPARELPIPGVTSEWLLGFVENNNKSVISKDTIIHKVTNSKAEVIITLGAGDIGQEVESIKKALCYAS
ncbi:UDP-N-acetylmuramate--L-alanine ligase [Ichthyenterobacterium sp. W332]|uniref:UDP-N-acetylmuramate--L-alanine ligase n=1 Tax=Microcosmobacter mediterraneus TaxID=3075607 RepID=A0ABU2YJY6_9FLAO|nr:UDP-N-acetylmuramate--L-alanine ligase [Ichthyenterobacterium sp. W332]MDT0558466.1 UDP-N-acetylmuramate--L-alanine ligase [Ichthyenterobacterium sp. W332]